MHCPYCHAPLSEDLPACPRCGVNMEKASAYFGTPPHLTTDISDLAGVLRPAELRVLRQRIGEFGRRFPQSGFSAVFMAIDRDVPGAAYAWWIFNRCQPAGGTQEGGGNRQLFLLVDTAGHHAWLTQGYGLEPFVSESRLLQCLEQAQPHFVRQAWAEGIAALLQEAEAVLREVVTALPRVFGLMEPSPPLNSEPALAR
jgi:uncharacterized membrane protein YgcG